MMTQQGELLVLGRQAFHDPSLASDVCCLNSWWGRDHMLDVRLEEIVAPSLRGSSCSGGPPEGPSGGPSGRPSDRGPPQNGTSCSCGRRFLCVAWRVRKLLALLQAQLDWRVGFLSAGEKRRAQLVASLAEPKKVYLFDEATADLDIVSRKMLCSFLLAESRQTGSTLIYSTHVFDGLEEWPTHLLYLHEGTVKVFRPLEQLDESVLLLRLETPPTASSLFQLVRSWLLSEPHNRRLQAELEEVLT
ncbi:hypothetical protein Efla_001011 [Eimeria flavescens]